MPAKLTLVESIVEAALLIPFILWFAEAVVGIVVGVDAVRTYWLPIAYVLPVYIGVVIALVLFAVAGIISAVKRYLKTKN